LTQVVCEIDAISSVTSGLTESEIGVALFWTTRFADQRGLLEIFPVEGGLLTIYSVGGVALDVFKKDV